MGIALAVYWFGYLVLALIVFLIIAKILTVLKFKYTGLILLLVALIMILYPFRRAIFYKTVFYFYERSPLQEIHETVENPVSVYWEDNVWPGWDELSRQRMVEQFLDGIHLKALALNGDDGKIYLYRADTDSFRESKKIWPEYFKVNQIWIAARIKAKTILKNGENTQDHWNETSAKERVFSKTQPKGYFEQKQVEIKRIMDNGAIYQSRADLPEMHYRVELNFLPKSLLVNNKHKIIHADRISIIDVKKNKEIAYSTRYMAYGGFLNS
ncbi:MAG: hypothetical protein KKH99_05980, partial [Proteobacteria bacterium]|nr:hypothetical protein [Pseudomonadota bacterium]